MESLEVLPESLTSTMNMCTPSILHTLRMSVNKQYKLQSCSHHMSVTFVKSVLWHVTQIWANMNTGGRGERKLVCHIFCYWEMLDVEG